ncbi:MAG: T9SS type A sorting domain-containing protein [Chitinophagaceae bacterium]|nr:T9SS type A sorting domain-containing protein [Chitinophagaceae bacterium]
MLKLKTETMLKWVSIVACTLFSSIDFLQAQSMIQWDWEQQNHIAYSDLEYKDNYIYAAGNFTDSTVTLGTNTYLNIGGNDIIIAKMDTLGNVIWSHHIASNNSESLLSICVDNNNNVLAIGTMEGTLQVGSTTLTSNGGSDVLMIKCSSTGSFLFAKNVGTIGNDSGNDLTTDYNNDIHAVISKSMDTMAFAGTINYGYRNAILKWSSNGTEEYMTYVLKLSGSLDATGTTTLIKYNSKDSSIIIGGTLTRSSSSIGFCTFYNSSNPQITLVMQSSSWGAIRTTLLCKTDIHGNAIKLLEVYGSPHAYIHDLCTNPVSGEIYFTQRVIVSITGSTRNHWLRTDVNLDSASYLQIPMSNTINYSPYYGAPLKINYFNNTLYGLLYQQNLNSLFPCSEYFVVKYDLSTNQYNIIGLDMPNQYASGIGYNDTYILGSTTSISKSCQSGCPIPSFSLNPAPDVSLCFGSSQTIGYPACYYVKGGTPPYTFHWSPSIGLNSITAPQPYVSGLTATTTYTLTVTDSLMNTLYDTVTVYFNPLPTLSYTISPSTPVCSGDTVTITYSGAQDYQLNPSPIGQYLNNPHQVVVNTDTVFNVKGTLNGCSSYVSPQIQTFKTTIESSKPVFCENDSVNLKAAPGASFSWQPGSYTGDSIWVYPLGNTTYTVTASNGAGCTATTSLTLFTSSTLSVVATPNSICLGDSVSLSASGNGYNLGTTTMPTGYCSPVSYGTLSGMSAISGFQLEQLYNYDNVNSNFYSDYTNAIKPLLIAGSSYNVKLIKATIDNLGIGIWIDFNHDGDFNDTSEFLGQNVIPYNLTKLNFPISIPLNVVPGFTKIRILCGAGATIVSGNSCNYNYYGEYEDYIVRLATSESLSSFAWSGGTTPNNGAMVSALPTNVGNQNYTVSTTDFNGCYKTETTSVNVGDKDTTFSNLTICSNQLPFSWNGQSLNASGNYSFQTLNASGCDSTSNLYLTVLTTSISSDTVSICSNLLPFLWNGQSISTSGNYVYISTASNGCDSIAHLNFNVLPTSSTTTSLAICSNQIPYFWNGQSLNASGNYLFQTLNTSGCDSTDNLQLTVNPLPLPVIQWNGTTMNAQNFYTSYQWYYNGTVITGAIDSMYNPILPGNYTVEVIDSNGCTGLSALYNFIPVACTTFTNDLICIYPNPTNSKLNISYGLLSIYSIVLQDIQGKKLMEISCEKNVHTKEIDLSGFANGMYLIKVIGTNRSYTQRITKN